MFHLVLAETTQKPLVFERGLPLSPLRKVDFRVMLASANEATGCSKNILFISTQ